MERIIKQKELELKREQQKGNVGLQLRRLGQTSEGRRFGKTRFGNHADDYISDLIEEEKEIIVPKIEHEVKLAEKIIDAYPKNDTLKQRAINLTINIKKKLVKLVTIENGKTFVNNLIGLLKTLTALLGAMYLLYEGYNALYNRSSVFRGITRPIEFLLNKVRKEHDNNTQNIVNFAHNVSDDDDFIEPRFLQRRLYNPSNVTNYTLQM
jgi:hypothetical protein